MKIIISYPPLQGRGSPMLTQNRQFQWYKRPSYIYPVVSAYAATLLREEGFDVIWNDCIAQKWNSEKFYEFVKKEKPDIIVFESKTPVITQHWEIINKLKKTYRSSLFIVLAGDHVTALPEESMESSLVDFVITGGDYDTLLLSIAKYLRNKEPLNPGIYYRKGGLIRNTGQFVLSQDLNKLPFIDRKLTKAYLYGEKWKRKKNFFYTMAGRDCWWGRCGFCSWTNLYPKVRLRTPDNLLDEITMLFEEFEAEEIFDDMGTFPFGDWLNSFCEGMIKRDLANKILFSCNMRFGVLTDDNIKLMKRAGFRKLKMGFESANQVTLDRLNKGVLVKDIEKECERISSMGLGIHLTVMVGYPWESREDLLNTLLLASRLMKKGSIEMLQSTILVPYPGTALYEEALREKWLNINPKDYFKYDMSDSIFSLNDLEDGEIVRICKQIYKNFFNPSFIFRNLLNIKSVADLNYVFRGAFAALGHIIDFSGKRK